MARQRNGSVWERLQRFAPTVAVGWGPKIGSSGAPFWQRSAIFGFNIPEMTTRDKAKLIVGSMAAGALIMTPGTAAAGGLMAGAKNIAVDELNRVEKVAARVLPALPAGGAREGVRTVLMGAQLTKTWLGPPKTIEDGAKSGAVAGLINGAGLGAVLTAGMASAAGARPTFVWTPSIPKSPAAIGPPLPESTPAVPDPPFSAADTTLPMLRDKPETPLVTLSTLGL